jgi:class 3 adenylate cyclase/ABC-type branched-subunit amino acid transport system substrate-binding protein/streptogramin lyase
VAIDPHTGAITGDSSDLRSFLIADVRGYTRFTNERGDEAASDLAARFAELTRGAVAAYGGTLLELRGDEALCVFPSARQAIRAAIELQRRFRERADGEPVIPLGVGMGLDAGEAVPTEGGYRGGALNLAARLCSIALPGQILASEAVVHMAQHVPGVGFHPRKRARMKGLDRPVKVIEIVPEEPLPPLPEAPASGRRRFGTFGAIVAVVAAVAVLAGIAAWRSSNSGKAPSIPGNSIVPINAMSNDVGAPLGVGTTPSAVAAGEGSVWVLNADDRTVSRIDLATGRVASPKALTEGTPAAIAVGEGSLWVVTGIQSTSSQVRLAVSSADVLKLDPHTAVEFPRSRVRLSQPAERAFTGQSNIRVAAGAGRVWVVNPSRTVSVIDPVHNSVIGTATDVDAGAIALDRGSAWVVDAGPAITRIDRDAVVNERIAVPAISLSSLVVSDGAAWAVDPYGGVLYRVELEGRNVVTTVRVGQGAESVAAGPGAIWVANPVAGAVLRIDPSEQRVVARLPFGNPPLGLATAGNQVWVTVGGSPEATVSAASSCDEVFYGGSGAPDHVIVSDFPMQGPASATTLPMTAAIRLALAQHSFQAGPYRIGYQACDDSTAQAGNYDLDKCVANARSYAANRVVIGVVGPHNSACSAAQLPILNGARDGPVAMVSPTNSDINLTHEYKDIPGGTGGLYPSGVRNYARVYPSYDVQAAAQAMLLKSQGRHRVFIVKAARDPYATSIAASFGHAARRLSLGIAGMAVWDDRRSSADALGGRIRRSRADAVVLAGLLNYGISAGLVADLRSTLGDRVALVGDDGFLPIPVLLRQTRGLARGMYITAAAAFPKNLPVAGREFLRRFAAAHPEQPASGFTAYAAQAAEVLLAAIRNSDGTRQSVTAELLRVRVREGVLGTFRFDSQGDPSRATVTVFRVSPGGHIEGLPFDYQDSVVSALITPDMNLAKAGADD